MSDLTIMMPDGLHAWVNARVAEGRYADAADYLRDLVRSDQDIAGQHEWVRSAVAKGLASGVVDAEPENVLKEIMARLPHG